jgi:hypothetical protein
MKKTIQNYTPHAVTVAGVSYPPSGAVARVTASFSDIVDGFCRQQFGEGEGLPAPQPNTLYIVSALVFGATERADVIAPATGHPDVVRNDKGHIVSVPAFVKK